MGLNWKLSTWRCVVEGAISAVVYVSRERGMKSLGHRPNIYFWICCNAGGTAEGLF